MALTVKTVEAQLRKFNGNQSACARAHGVSRQAVSYFLQKHPRLRALTAELRETRVDNAESGLDLAIANREAWAIALTLKTLGRDRGYVEKAAQPEGGALAVLAAFERLAAPATAPQDEVALRITRVLDAASGPPVPPDAAG